VSAGEEVEVQLSLNAGRLMVFEGRRPWPPGLGGCRPLVSVKSPVAVPPPPSDGQAEATVEGGEESVLPEPAPDLPPEVRKCGLPATFVLPPGRWEVAVSGGNAAPRSTEVVVEAGRTVILSSSPGDPLQTVGVDKDQGSH
jgi:hypothetical protein